MRILNEIEKEAIEEIVSSYGNVSLAGGSFLEQDNDFVYYLSIDNFELWTAQSNRIAKEIKDILGADRLFIQGVEF